MGNHKAAFQIICHAISEHLKRQRRCVGTQNRINFKKRFKGPVEFLFYIGPFNNRFNDPITVFDKRKIIPCRTRCNSFGEFRVHERGRLGLFHLFDCRPSGIWHNI